MNIANWWTSCQTTLAIVLWQMDIQNGSCGFSEWITSCECLPRTHNDTFVCGLRTQPTQSQGRHCCHRAVLSGLCVPKGKQQPLLSGALLVSNPHDLIVCSNHDSAWSLVLVLVACLGAVLACVRVCKKQKQKKTCLCICEHTGAQERHEAHSFPTGQKTRLNLLTIGIRWQWERLTDQRQTTRQATR